MSSNSNGAYSMPGYISIQYTKAIDGPNSFTTDMIQDYTSTSIPYTNEQIIDTIEELW